mgnify:CR=1 FL=1
MTFKVAINGFGRIGRTILRAHYENKKKQINKLVIKWSNKKAITIVASSKGYPSKQSKVSEIKNTNKILLNNNQYLFTFTNLSLSFTIFH